MSIFEVRNYTQYNTTDLIAVLDAVEAAIRGQSLPVEAAKVVVYAGDSYPSPRVGGVVTFKVYTTKKEWHETKTYNCKKGGYEVKKTRLLVKEGHRWRNDPSNDIRIVPPKRIWIGNPLEALAEQAKSLDDALVVPEEVRKQLVLRLLRLYGATSRAYSGYRYDQDAYDYAKDALRLAPQIRIEDRRAATVNTAEKHRVARHKAHRSWGESRHAMRSLRYYLHSLEKSHVSALRHLTRSRVPLLGKEQQVAGSMGELGAAVDRVQVLLDELLMHHEPEGQEGSAGSTNNSAS